MATLNAKRLKAIKARITTFDEASSVINVLVYGQNGSEKTRFAASAPHVLVADVNEKGTRSARQYKDGRVFPVKVWPDITYLYWFLRDHNPGYESIAIDNLTTLAQMCMTHVLKEGADRDPNKDPAIASMRDWGKVNELMKPMLLNYRNLPLNTIFIAQERVIEDDEEESQHMPDLSKGIRGIATGSVDIIGRTYKKEVRRGKKGKKKEEVIWEPRMLVGPSDKFVTKDRTGQLPRIVRNPTVPAFLEAAGAIPQEDDD